MFTPSLVRPALTASPNAADFVVMIPDLAERLLLLAGFRHEDIVTCPEVASDRPLAATPPATI